MNQLDRKELYRLSQAVLETLQRYDVLVRIPDNVAIDSHVDEMMASEFTLPLEALSMEGLELSYFDVESFDDGQRFLEPGYFIDRLNQLSQSSKGGIQFTDVEEQGTECEVTLTFKLNSISHSIEMDVCEEEDRVPEPFENFLVDTLNQEFEGWTYVLGAAHEAASRYYRVPVGAAHELRRLEADYLNQ